MSKKVAIIGGGIFGVVTAINFAKQGFVTDLYEQNSDILLGATANSQNRLHLGLHYPRDLETAIQSTSGFTKFKERFPLAINTNFPNYYSISLQNSKISEGDFLNFASKAGIEIKVVKESELEECGIVRDKISTIYQCEEAVIDIDILRETLRKEVLHYGVNLKLNQQVSSLTPFSKDWELKTFSGDMNLYNFVFKATYGSDHIVDNSDLIKRSTYEFHATLILEIKNPYPNFGFTVIDGDFITLLPKGFSGNQLLYAPSISTRKRFIGDGFPTEWMLDENLDSVQRSLLERLNCWFIGYENVQVVSKMQAIRAIQPNMEKTDRRTSLIRELGENYYEMWSGKIDHCIDIADEMLNLAR
jgi:hypothetical protein